MLLLNFAHPLTPAHFDAIARLLQKSDFSLDVRDIPAQFDPQQPYAAQTRALVDGVGLSGSDWQTTPMLINLPGHSAIAACVLAELHGRMGYFPAVLRLRPLAGTTPPQFEVAEIVNLQETRDQARSFR